MKYLSVIVLLLLVAFHITGVVPAYLVMVHEIKTEVTIELADVATLSEISISNEDLDNASIFQEVEEHEFRYLGKLYDFSKSEKRGKFTLFYCLEDTKEQLLNDALAVCLGNDDYHHSGTNLPFKNLIHNLSKDFLGHDDVSVKKIACLNVLGKDVFVEVSTLIENGFPPLSPPPDFV